MTGPCSSFTSTTTTTSSPSTSASSTTTTTTTNSHSHCNRISPPVGDLLTSNSDHPHGSTPSQEQQQPHKSHHARLAPIGIGSLPSHLFNNHHHHHHHPNRHPNSLSSSQATTMTTTHPSQHAQSPSSTSSLGSIIIHPATPTHRRSPSSELPSSSSTRSMEDYPPIFFNFPLTSPHPTATSSQDQPPHPQDHHQEDQESLKTPPIITSPPNSTLTTPTQSSNSLTSKLYLPTSSSPHRPSHQKARSETDMVYRFSSSSSSSTSFQPRPTIRKKSGEEVRSSLKITGFFSPPPSSILSQDQHSSTFSTSQDEQLSLQPSTATTTAAAAAEEDQLHPQQSLYRRSETYDLTMRQRRIESQSEFDAGSPIPPNQDRKDVYKSLPTTPSAGAKVVHFDQKLEHVRHFLSQGRPIAVSRDGSPEETETEDEYPFPRTTGIDEGGCRMRWVKGGGGHRSESDLVQEAQSDGRLWISNRNPSSSAQQQQHHHQDMVRLRYLEMNPNSGKEILGEVWVKNIAFEKLVVARFTFDDWRTVSEVTSSYDRSEGSDDVFLFKIRVQDISQDDHHHHHPHFGGSTQDHHRRHHHHHRRSRSLPVDQPQVNGNGLPSQIGVEHRMWLTVRYKSNQQEWWDNNCGQNYQIEIGRWGRADGSPSCSPMISGDPFSLKKSSLGGSRTSSSGSLKVDERTDISSSLPNFDESLPKKKREEEGGGVETWSELRAKLDLLVDDETRMKRKSLTTGLGRFIPNSSSSSSSSSNKVNDGKGGINGLFGGGLSSRYDFGLSLKEAVKGSSGSSMMTDDHDHGRNRGGGSSGHAQHRGGAQGALIGNMVVTSRSPTAPGSAGHVVGEMGDRFQRPRPISMGF